MLHTDLIAPIPELLRRHAAARGGKIAYRDAGASVTYAELLDRTGRLAGHLADRGIAADDTVAIMLPNSVQWVESCLAIARAGAISVPISYDATEPEIAYRLADAGCKAVFTSAERGDLCARLKSFAPNLETLDRDRSRHVSRGVLRYAKLVAEPAQSAPRDRRFDARDRVHSLHVRHHRPRQGRPVDAARHVVGHRRMLGADHRPVASATPCCRRCRCFIPTRSIFRC
jgi:long-chain acyl-CoA synthetase